MKKNILILGLTIALAAGNMSIPAMGLDDFIEESEESEIDIIETELLETDAETGSGYEAETDETIAEDELQTDQDLEEEVLIEEVFEVNPVLADVILDEHETLDHYDANDINNRVYYETSQECLQVLRNGMLNRENPINIYYMGDEYQEGYAKMVQDLAVAHDMRLDTNTGDYLRYHYKSVNRRTFKGSVGGKVYYRFEYDFSYLSTAEQETAVTSAIKTIMRGIKRTGNTKKNISRIYEYVTSHVVYDGSDYDDYNVHSAYAAVIHGRSVCQGYATMLYRMLREAGINCRIVGGRAGSINHAWVMVELKGRWYFLDPTWDAGRKPGEWQYYLIGSQRCFKDHTWEDAYQTDPLFATYDIAAEDCNPDDSDELETRPETESSMEHDTSTHNNNNTGPETVKEIESIVGPETESETPSEPEKEPEAAEIVLDSLYANLLGREADSVGMAYWMDILQSGKDDSLGVLCGFLNSDEFKKKDISETQTFVKKLLADESFWQYSELTVQEETLLTTINSYNVVLGRQPEAKGLRYWINKVEVEHIPYREMFRGFVFSPERESKPVDDKNFIEMLYVFILNREPSAEELDGWLTKCAAGSSREEIFDALTDTDEYHRLYNE